MKSTLMFPRNDTDGKYLEDVAIFMARRCRTVKSHDELWKEVVESSPTKKSNFLDKVVGEEWAIDIYEFAYLTYDMENIPYWLVMELLRHRLIAREFSLEMLSQRAISPLKLVINSNNKIDDLRELYKDYIEKVDDLIINRGLKFEDIRDYIPQGVEVNLGISGNVRAFHHYFFMRNSPLLGGKGGAHPQFQKLADSMLNQARLVYPNIVKEVIRA